MKENKPTIRHDRSNSWFKIFLLIEFAINKRFNDPIANKIIYQLLILYFISLFYSSPIIWKKKNI